MNIPSRLNLCTPVRNALLSAGYSTVKVTNAVNAALGQLTCKNPDESGNTGGSKANTKKGTFNVSVSVSFKYHGTLNEPLLFDAWNSAIEKAEKLATFDGVSLPGILIPWLDRFAKNERTPEPVNA